MHPNLYDAQGMAQEIYPPQPINNEFITISLSSGKIVALITMVKASNA